MRFQLKKTCKETRLALLAVLLLPGIALADSSKPEQDHKPQGKGNETDSTSYDSANRADTIKSWTSESAPGEMDLGFLNRLKWSEQNAGPYVLRTGVIFDRWIAAMQFKRKGKVVLTEYTPPSEYVVFIDPKTGEPSHKLRVADVNGDGNPEIAFLHEKLDDENYHMYSVYSLQQTGPKLIWKSGGKFGDWITQAHRRSGTMWKGAASSD